MEDKHIIADIMAETIKKDGPIQGITMAHIRAKCGMPEYKLNRAIDDLIEVCGVTFRNDAIMLSNEFIYGYQYRYKRLYYDEFNGKPLSEKLQLLKDLKDRYMKTDVAVEDYFYVLGRIDQNSFVAGYI